MSLRKSIHGAEKGLLHALAEVTHVLAEGNRRQRRYEHKQAMVHALMGGPYSPMGGNPQHLKMSYAKANLIADTLLKMPTQRKGRAGGKKIN